MVQNVDLHHYPAPFKAFYDWTLSDATSTIDTGSFQLAGWSTTVIDLAIFEPGSYTLTMVDTDLGTSATTDFVLPDCANEPGPSPDPLPPLVIVSSVECGEHIAPDIGSGSIAFAVQNQPATMPRRASTTPRRSRPRPRRSSGAGCSAASATPTG